jgi:hypothetical protein
LTSDKTFVDDFNDSVTEDFKIRLEVLPEPYLGNVESEIVLLNGNPGFSELDILFYEKKEVRALWRKNILHEPMEYPFYLLAPPLRDEPGPRWWRRRLKQLIRDGEDKLRVVANHICCIEFFPYHSRRLKFSGQLLDSQKYGFDLVEKAIDRGAVIVIMRSAELWLSAVPRLGKYKRVYRLNSVQNVAISLKNCPNGFAKIIKVLESAR